MTARNPSMLAAGLRARLREHGERTALWVDGADSIGYRDLLRLSTAIGRHLDELTEAPRAGVAIIGPPGVALSTGVLGALLSGHVPALVDTAQPARRIQQTLDQVDPAVVIWCCTSPADVSWTGSALHIDGSGPGTPCPSSGTSRPGRSRSFGPGVGYLGFTSGSRGAPRAIVGSASGLWHFLTWQIQTFTVDASARFGQLTSPGFDVFYRDLLTPLVAGAVVCIPGPEQRAGNSVIDWLAAAQVTHLHTVPSLARYWLRAARSATPRLRITFMAGESLTGTLVADWRAATGPDQRVINLYGTAEATLAQTAYEVPFDCPPGAQPIGTPLPGVSAILTDERGEPCAPGETGEIVMGSPFLSHGYLSADRAPAPLSRYRTGDRGHRGETGLLHVVGRLDREVKIRGVRVNLDEVGAVLSSHPLVDGAVVITGTDPTGGLRLEAHIAVTGPIPAGRDLRRYLASRLPDQMLPAVYHVASQLPLGATGKVSARVLESRTAQRTETGER